MRTATVAAAKRPCLDRSILPTSLRVNSSPNSALPHNHDDDHQHDNNNNNNSATTNHPHHLLIHFTSSASPPPPKRPRIDAAHSLLKLANSSEGGERNALPHPCAPIGGVEPEIWLAQYLNAPAPTESCYLSDPPPDTVAAHHRETVVLWLLQARSSLRVARPTMYAAVSIMDAYLSSAAPLRLHLLQLLAAACVFIAVKTSEQYSLSVARLVDIAAGAFDAQSLIQMEAIVLNRLSFRVAVQTSYSALPYLADIAAPFDRRVTATATFATDIALTDHHCCCIAPATIALAAISLACVVVLGSREDHLKGMLTNEVSLTQIDAATVRMIDAWRRAVTLHDNGDSNFLIRDAPLVAARIFPDKVRYALDCEFGVLIDVGDGTFAKWAANHEIEDLVPELY